MSSNEERKLDQTSTWAVASVVAIIIVISLFLEIGLHRIKHWLEHKKKTAMVEALEKIKAELMILGFISLLFTFVQYQIEEICIPEHVAQTMLPCKLKPKDGSGEKQGRRLLWEKTFSYSSTQRRLLQAEKNKTCSAGKVPFISAYGVHQIHIFIFFLAIWHLVTSGLTVILGKAKIRKWKHWERETQTVDYEFSNDPTRFRFVHENSFVRQHNRFWTRNVILFYIASFFRQFFRSVRKSDYLTMRHGFISSHLARGIKFDFQKYIKRSLEDDFKVVVGISPILWASSVVVLLLNVQGWKTMFWISIVPLVILLVVGTKLQAIITEMALEITQRHVVVQGMPVVELHDRHFWFEKPGLVLFLIHFTLFQNAFQVIYFIWIWYTFGLNSCFHEDIGFVIARIGIGFGVQILCSYVTLPLYALVSQLGTNMKTSIFDDHTSEALKKWHKSAKNRHRTGKSTGHSPFITPGASPSASPAHPMQRFRTFTNTMSSHGTPQRRYFSDHEASDTENELLSPTANNSSHGGVHAHVDIESVGRKGSAEHHHRHPQQQQPPPVPLQGENKDEFSFVNEKPSNLM